MSVIKSLDNYRKLKPNEVLRKDDIWVSQKNPKLSAKISGCIGNFVESYPGFDFYRRKHTKKIVSNNPTPIMDDVDAVKAKTPVTRVCFSYMDTVRHVQVIKMDEKYLKGLEIATSKFEKTRVRKNKYKFKSFLRNKIQSPIVLVGYGSYSV